MRRGWRREWCQARRHSGVLCHECQARCGLTPTPGQLPNRFPPNLAHLRRNAGCMYPRTRAAGRMADYYNRSCCSSRFSLRSYQLV